MLETGMRVGDAIRYDPSVTVKGEHLWIYTFVPQKKKKTDQPKPLESYLTERLKTAIDQCEWLSPNCPFHYGAFRNKAYLANEVYNRMQTIGERCGVADCRPHRLRDTFAVRKLLGGFQLDDVSRLLGREGHRDVLCEVGGLPQAPPGTLGCRVSRERVGPRFLGSKA